MNGTTRSRVIEQAVDQRRRARRRATAPSAAASGPTPARSSSAVTTVLSAMIEPTDRSMPPDTITIVIPSAATQTMAVWRAISSRLARREELRADQHAEERARRARGRRSTPRSSSEPPRRHDAPCAPDASISSACSVQSAAGRGVAEPAARHHRDPIADAEQLRQIAADEQHGLAAPGRPCSADDQLVDQRVDLRLAPDVDAARRLVEHAARRRRGAAAARARPSAGCRPTARRPPGAGRAQRMPSRSIQRAAAASCRAGSTMKPRARAARAASASGCRRCSARARALRRCGPRSASPCPAASGRAARPARHTRRRVMRPPLHRLEAEDRRAAAACARRRAARRCRGSRRGAA